VIRKLGLSTDKTLAVTDCEGINKLYDMAVIITALIKFFQGVKVLAIIIDANELDFTIATLLTEKYGLDYFDALIVAQCITRNAKPLTTDKEVIEAVAKESKSK